MAEVDIYEKFELEHLRGRPDGPVKFIEQLGMEVPTYIDPRKDMWGSGVQGVCMYHVPIKMRGFYRVRPGVTVGPHGEEIDAMNYCMCMSKNLAVRSGGYKTKRSGQQCKQKAQNYSGHCGIHGGALHPLDKVGETHLSREALYAAGRLDVAEMTDEELARGQVRKDDGTWSNLHRIPATVFRAAQAELFKRADQKLQESLIDVVGTMTEIANSSAYEPEVRVRAATWVYERVRGKNPDVVIHTQDKPFEIMMTDMVLSGGSRAESRAQRGIESAVDAEVIEGYDDLAVVYDDSHNLDTRVDTVENDEGIELVPLQAETPPHYGPAGKPMTTPPVDPILRDKWEKAKLSAEDEVQETVAELAARLKKARNEARAKRYAARAKGLTSIESHAYTWVNEELWVPDPNDPGYEMALNVIRFGELNLPKVPAHVKAQDTRRIRNTR